MALEKTTISINLGNGLDQKTDSKVGPDNKFNYMQNWIYDKLGKLYKRFGTDKLTDQIVTTFPNPLSIGTSEIPSSTFSYGEQLLSQNKGALYSYFEDQDKWYFKGHYYPLELDVQTTVSSERNYINPSSYYVAGLRIIVSNALDPQVLSTAGRYTVIEDSTGNYLVDDAALPTGTEYRVMSFAARTFIVYRNGNNLTTAEVNLTTGTLSAPVVVANDINSFSTIFPFNFSITNKVGVGERAMVVYYTTGNQVKVIAVKNDGTIDAGITPYTNAQTLGTGFGIVYNTTSDALMIIYQTSAFVVRAENLVFTSSSITQTAAFTVFSGTTVLSKSFDMTVSPVAPTEVIVLFDQMDLNSYVIGGFYSTEVEPTIYKAVISSTAVVTAASAYIRGFRIAAKSVSDNLRNTIYSFIQNTSGLNTTYFMIDLLKGKEENAPFVQAKWMGGQAYFNVNTEFISQTSMIGNKIYLSLPRVVDLIGNPVNSPQLSPNLLKKTGIAETFIELTPEKSGTNSFLSNSVLTSGGYLGMYDGSNFRETSFFLSPELIDVGSFNAGTGARYSINIFQQGSASAPEITQVFVPPGIICGAGPGALIFYSTSTQVNVYLIIDGSGTSPALPGVNIGVNILSSDTSYQVVDKMIVAINAASIGTTASHGGVGGNQLLLTNNSNGAVTDATQSFLSVIPPVGLSVGTYQYKAIWVYYDVHGQAVLSATSPAITITISAANTVVGLNVYAPLLTNSDVNTVTVQWFRTKANGSEFFKISDTSQDLKWSLGLWNYTLRDNKSDTAIDNSPENLYTTGGVLDNFQVPQIKHVSKFKNRLIASGSDDQTGFYYSKTAIPGAPVEFAAEFFIQLDNDSDPITGHAQLDDKLIVFKERKIYYLAGDGANDLGQNQTFTVPLLIATDVGCLSHNSIVTCPLGLLFKSDKGIYLLNRALQLSYIGKEVEEYNGNIISNGLLIDDQNQIRFNLQDENISLVYDYIFNRWTVFTNYGGTEATIWKSNYTRIDYSGRCFVENRASWVDTDSLVESYQPTFETHWLQLKNVQDYQRIYRLAFLGDLRSPHNLNYKIYYDYDETRYDSYTFSSSNIDGTQLGDSVYQPIVHLRQQKCDAIKVVIEVEPLGGTEECLQLVDMAFIVGVKRGLMKVRSRKML